MLMSLTLAMYFKIFTECRFFIIFQVVAFALFLMDGENANVSKLDQRRRISISKLDKIFQVYHSLIS